MTAAEMTASFRKQTRKRKGDAFQEDGVWCVVDADGHVWEHHDDEWTRFTGRMFRERRTMDKLNVFEQVRTTGTHTLRAHA